MRPAAPATATVILSDMLSPVPSRIVMGVLLFKKATSFGSHFVEQTFGFLDAEVQAAAHLAGNLELA